MQRTSFEKLQRERQKKAKAAAKRARREERGTTATEPEFDVGAESDGEAPLSPAELLYMVQVVHERFEAGKIGLEEFEEKKTELLARLPVD
ncbi:MAG: hypothetical protein ACRDZ7_09790 [Acidimicrobiia bacterium]